MITQLQLREKVIHIHRLLLLLLEVNVNRSKIGYLIRVP